MATEAAAHNWFARSRVSSRVSPARSRRLTPSTGRSTGATASSPGASGVILTPSWLPVTPAADNVVISIDPESAFGSGEHGSTRGALALLERHLEDGDAMLDFGSGSGILAIAAAKLGARSAIGIEVDEESLPIAAANAAKNGVADRVTFLLGEAQELGALAGPAELICSNILRTVNTLLLPDIAAALAGSGIAIFAGMEEAEADIFRTVLLENGWTVVDEVKDAGWWSVAASRA